MCGIFGVQILNNTPEARHIRNVLISHLGSESMGRGTDAGGIAVLDKNLDVKIIKQPGPFTNLLNSQGYYDCLGYADKTVIGHTRAATQGTHKKNRNNHPILIRERDRRLALVHNGQIYNDNELFNDLQLPRYGKVDSEIIARLLYEYIVRNRKGLKKGTKLSSEQLEGWASVAFLVSGSAYLNLFTLDGTISIYRDKEMLAFASTESILDAALRRTEEYFLKKEKIQLDCFDGYFEPVDDGDAFLIQNLQLKNFEVEGGTDWGWGNATRIDTRTDLRTGLDEGWYREMGYADPYGAQSCMNRAFLDTTSFCSLQAPHVGNSKNHFCTECGTFFHHNRNTEWRNAEYIWKKTVPHGCCSGCGKIYDHEYPFFRIMKHVTVHALKEWVAGRAKDLEDVQAFCSKCGDWVTHWAWLDHTKKHPRLRCCNTTF